MSSSQVVGLIQSIFTPSDPRCLPWLTLTLNSWAFAKLKLLHKMRFRADLTPNLLDWLIPTVDTVDKHRLQHPPETSSAESITMHAFNVSLSQSYISLFLLRRNNKNSKEVGSEIGFPFRFPKHLVWPWF